MAERFHKNAIASSMALVGLITLLVSFWFPCVTTYQFGSAKPMTLPATVRELWQSGSPVLAIIVGAFSMVFPVIKLAGILLITSPAWIWGDRHRHRAHRLMEKFGALSLLDVFVVALLIVLVKVGGFLKMEASAGIFLFAAAVLLSIAASFLVMIPSHEEVPASADAGLPSAIPPDSKPVRFPWLIWVWILVLGLLVGCGLALVLRDASGTVETITVRTKAMSPQILPSFETPDYRILVKRKDAASVKLPTKDDTPIGNGLAWGLSNPLSLDEIAEVQLWEDDLLSDNLIDRITPAGRLNEGERFVFHLDGPVSLHWLVGIILLSSAGLLVLWFAIAWLAKHAVRA